MPSHNVQLGRCGEDLAAAAYERQGYRVLARNWRDGRAGELDLVLVRDRQLVVCEVKARSSTRYGMPAEAVDRRKQLRLRGLAAAFVRAHGLRPAGIRFDVAAVLGDRVDILEAAF